MRRQRLEINRDGWFIRTRRFLCFESRSPLSLDSILTIRAVMWDCFSCHAFGFRLLLADGSSVCVTDLDQDWPHLREKLLEAFPEIDRQVISQVEAAFPGELERDCWSR